MSVLKRLSVLQHEAAATPVPTRKYFHMGDPEVLEEVGECLPMIAWVDDNLSRYVVSDRASTSWGRGGEGGFLVVLPNIEVKSGEGVFLITGPGEDESRPHPGGRGRMHFVHLGRRARLFDGGPVKLYIYRLEGVQVKGVLPK
jgi:hypothetical protein